MKHIHFILFAALSMVLCACGYQLETGGYINNDVTRVAVTVLENKSAETGADIIFTNALIREVLQKTDTKVVDGSFATATLEGTIKSITFAFLSRSTIESVVERRVSAVIDLRMVNREGEVIWSVVDFNSTEDYLVSQDRIIDESNKTVALEKIAARSAERLISRMLTNF